VDGTVANIAGESGAFALPPRRVLPRRADVAIGSRRDRPTWLIGATGSRVGGDARATERSARAPERRAIAVGNGGGSAGGSGGRGVP